MWVHAEFRSWLRLVEGPLHVGGTSKAHIHDISKGYKGHSRIRLYSISANLNLLESMSHGQNSTYEA